MHTLMFYSPKKGKNAGQFCSHPIIQSVHPILGHISSNVVFHLSSLHFHIQNIIILMPFLKFCLRKSNVDYQNSLWLMLGDDSDSKYELH